MIEKIKSVGAGVILLWLLLVVSNMTQGIMNFFGNEELEAKEQEKQAFATALQSVARRAEYIDQLNATKIEEIKSFNRKYGDFKDAMLKDPNTEYLNSDVPGSVAKLLHTYRSEIYSGGMPNTTEPSGSDRTSQARPLKTYDLIDTLALYYDAVEMCNGDKGRVRSAIIRQNKEAKKRMEEATKGNSG